MCKNGYCYYKIELLIQCGKFEIFQTNKLLAWLPSLQIPKFFVPPRFKERLVNINAPIITGVKIGYKVKPST